MTEHAESYKVLARAYRPTSFDSLIGQDALVRTLTNAIESNRIAHAFLLTGIRGVGKTTTARIIARALNCVGADGHGQATPNPCGVCEHCVAIGKDCHTDVLEMDAASKTGVGDIRDVIENSRYLPTSARYKIYIIDEVHMLSNSAFNALLKTLEEPPAHVKFIFATTEIRKIPVTILSRCQRFDLKRIDNAMMSSHLEMIAGKEGVQVDAAAFALLANASEGSVRDALSLLDQAIAHSETTVVTAETVRQMLGLADRTQLFTLFELLLKGEIDALLPLFNSLVQEGNEADAILRDLLDICHFVTRLVLQPALAQSENYPESERVLGKALAEKLGVAILARMWQMLLKGLNEVYTAPHAMMAAEMVLIRIAYSADLPSPAALIKDIKSGNVKIPDSSKSSVTPSVAAPVASQAHPSPSPREPVQQQHTDTEEAPKPAQALANPAKVEAKASVPVDFQAMVELFKEHREMVLHHHLAEDTHIVAYEPGLLTIRVTEYVPSQFTLKLKECLKSWTEMDWNVIISADEGQPTLQQQEDAKQSDIKREAEQDQVVQKVLEVFPGSAVSEVKVNA